MDRLQRRLKTAYDKAQAASYARGQRNKINFDLRVRVQDLQPDDKVLLRNLGVPGKHKLTDYWKSQPYVVCKHLPGHPVYQIRPAGSTGPLKTWHHNHLLPLSEAVHVPPQPDLQSTPTASQRSRPVTRSHSVPLAEDENSEDEEKDCLWPSQMPGPATHPHPLSSPPKVTEVTLRPEAPEFVPQSPPFEELEDPQSSLLTTDP